MTPRARQSCLYGLGVVLLILEVAGLGLQTHGDQNGLVVVMLLQGGAYLAAWVCSDGVRRRGTLPFILVLAFLLRLGPLLLPPFLSTDIYRYIWDGRVQGAGINPYQYVPSDDALAWLRDDAIYPNINRADYARTIYPPAAEMLFFAVTRLSQSVTAMKLAMLAFDAGTMFLVICMLRSGAGPPERVLIYAWHPLTYWEIAGSGHVDAALCFLLALAMLLRRRDRAMESGIVLGLATLIKFFPALLVPGVYRRWDWRMPVGLVATIILLYLPYLSAGWYVFGFLPGYAVEERFVGGSGIYWLSLVPYLTGFAAIPVAPYAVLALILFAGVSLAVTLRRQSTEYDFVGGMLALTLLVYILVTPHHSWYFLWALPMLCLVPYWPGILLTTASLFLYATFGLPRGTHDLLSNSLLYGPFLLAAVVQRCSRRSRIDSAKRAGSD